MVRPFDGFTVASPTNSAASIAFGTDGAASVSPSTVAATPAGRAAWISLPMRAIQSQRVYEQIAEHLTQLIRERDMRPGDRLPPERELASQLGVSRPSVREAMIALETAGLVEVRTGSGTYIREISSPGTFVLPWTTQDDAGPGVREQLQARKLIEPEMAALAVESITDVEIDALAAAIDRAEKRFVNGQTAEEDDYFFHVSLAESTRNTVLAGLVRHLWDLRRSEMWKTIRTRVVKSEHLKQVIADRRSIVDALRRRDAKAARLIMRRYIRKAEQRYFG
jgi:DNA-binding FadR family transcriptional regulator